MINYKLDVISLENTDLEKFKVITEYVITHEIISCKFLSCFCYLLCLRDQQQKNPFMKHFFPHADIGKLIFRVHFSGKNIFGVSLSWYREQLTEYVCFN